MIRYPTDVLYYLAQESAGDRFFVLCYLFGGAGSNISPPPSSPLGTQVDEVVRGLDHVEIVFYDHNCISHIHQSREDMEKFLYIRKNGDLSLVHPGYKEYLQ